MKYKFIISIASVLICSIKIFSQSDYQFNFLPGGLNFMPLKANNQEAKLGVLYYTSTTNLKVDIGNAVDILAYESAESQTRFTAGIEFMAYAFSKSYAGKRLQISAVDGFFGGNITYSKQYEKQKSPCHDSELFTTAPILLTEVMMLIKIYGLMEKNPIPFTKDFGEISVAHQIYFDSAILKYYGGLSYATLIRPDELKRYNFHLGFEIAAPNTLGKVFNNDVNLFLADHFFLDGTGKYSGSNQLMAGVKFGEWDKKGVVVYASYYSGRDMFSSYYDRKISKFGVGFSIDFF